jgi:UDP-N-acetylmuramate dehydrogenase
MSALLAEFGTDLEFSRPLAPLTSYRTGGPARYFIAARSADEIVRAVSGARRLRIPYFLCGGGSNLLVSDAGFDGLVVKVDVRGMKLLQESTIETGAGEDLMALVSFATEHQLTGLEFAAGIWGTVGGAIYGNAGAYGGEIGSVLVRLELVSQEGEIREVTPAYCKFAYRDSYLKTTQEVVSRAWVRLKPGNKAAIGQRVDEIIASRSEKHPNDGLSAGCFFKNIPDASEPHGKLPAGRLLEAVGAKGLQVGGARVYEKHANIIVNTGDATSQDIRKLADMLKERVREKFNIDLQEEVIQVGEF